MKNKIYIALLVVLVLCFGSYVTRSKSAPAPVVFEYKFAYSPNEKKCNELSAQGWELVAITSEGGGTMSSNITQFVFKRPKP